MAAAAAAALRRSPRRLLPILPRLRPLSTEAAPEQDPTPNPNPKPLTRLLSAIKSEPDPDRIAALLESSAHLPRFYSARPLHTLALHKLSRLRRPDLIHRVLLSQRSDPKSPKSEGFHTRILVHYSSFNLLDHALQLFDEIPNPTDLSFSALLTALLDHRKYDLVVEKFRQAPIEPGLVPHSLYLKALCAKGEAGTARKVLEEMRERKLVPDIVCYNAVLDGFMKSGDEAGFDEVMKEILDNGLEPNVFTYKCRVSMFCRKLQSFRGEELLDVMVTKGLHPSLGIFNEIVEGFCKEGDVGSAVRVFKRVKRMNGMDGVRVSLNADAYVVLIRSLVEKGEFGLGLKICRECLVRKFAPPFEVMKGLVEGLVKNARVEDAKGIVVKMNLVVRGEAADAWKKMESSLAW